jgi:hypothetical protein
MYDIIRFMIVKHIMGLAGAIALTVAANVPPLLAQSGEAGMSATGSMTGEDAAKEKAKEYFLAGVELFQKKNYAGALTKFKTAYAMDPNWKTQFNIGICHYELRQYPEALQVLSFFIEDSGDEATSENVDLAINAIVASRSEVFTIKLVESDEAIKVDVDGQPALISPDGLEIYMVPGTHHVRIWSKKDIYLDETVTGEKGEVREYKIQISGGAGGVSGGGEQPGGEEGTVPIVEKPGKKKEKGGGAKSGLEIAGWVLTGVAAGALVGGAVTGGLAIRERNLMEDLEKEHAEKQGSVSEEDLRKIEDEAWDHYDKGIVMARTATALFAVGGALAAAGIALLVVDTVKEKKAKTGGSVGISVTPAGLAVAGAF